VQVPFVKAAQKQFRTVWIGLDSRRLFSHRTKVIIFTEVTMGRLVPEVSQIWVGQARNFSVTTFRLQFWSTKLLIKWASFCHK